MPEIILPEGDGFLKKQNGQWSCEQGGPGGYDGDPDTIQQDATHRFVTDAEKTGWDSKAAGNHNHDSTYAASNHNHDSSYSALNHNHDSNYAPLNHTHYHSVLTLASNVATGANVTPVNLTGMSFTYVAGGIYRVDIYATVQSAAATTGHGFGVNCTTAPVLVSLAGGSQLANTGTGTNWSAIANNAIVGVTSGLPSANTNVMSLGGGILRMNASTGGTCQFIFRSETTAVTTCMANTVIMVTKVN